MSPTHLLSLALLAAPAADAAKTAAKPAPAAAALAGLKLRALGPAVTSGRVVGFAVHPHNRDHYYVAVASGGVWKTTNAGTTWTPVFDNEGSYSIGCVALDPKNPNVVWVGTGENNSQRSVGYGDGVYKSDRRRQDPGRTSACKRPSTSARSLIDPRDSDTVYVAAQGPLWGPGGDRGLYKTTDGGKTWTKVLNISENTGVTDVVLDPRNPDVLLAAAYQRRRHVWTLIDGGPESALYKLDRRRQDLEEAARRPARRRTWAASAWPSPRRTPTWSTPPSRPPTRRAASSARPTAARPGSGATTSTSRRHVLRPPRRRSEERGPHLRHERAASRSPTTAARRCGRSARSGSTSTTTRSGSTRATPTTTASAATAASTRASTAAPTWTLQANLPVTQFYDVAVDDERPVLPRLRRHAGQLHPRRAGPHAQRPRHHQRTTGSSCRAATASTARSTRRTRTPSTPRSQYGGWSASTAAPGSASASSRSRARASRRCAGTGTRRCSSARTRTRGSTSRPTSVFRSDDRGDSWKAVSGDLTRQLDRDKLPVMGKLWGPRRRAPSTSRPRSTATSSPWPSRRKKEGLLYAGTDDGLIQVTEDGGKTGARSTSSPACRSGPTSAACVASQHAAATVYAAFDNHKNGDFAPYLLQEHRRRQDLDVARRRPAASAARCWRSPRTTSTRTCSSPAPSSACSSPLDGGKKWLRLKGGLPTIAVRDLAIQRQDERPGRRHVRPRHLRPRRLLAAARPEAGGAGAGGDAVPGARTRCCTCRRGSTGCAARRSWARRSTPRTTRRSGRRSPTT